MDKYKIVALFGEAGSGKDYIQKEIMKTDFGKENLPEIISCTTRPPREGEIDGVHYYFIPYKKDFMQKEKIEYTRFRNWYYGTPLSSLDIQKINIGVFNINGIYQILKNKDIDCLPIRIICYDKIRLLRQLTRERNPDCMEICRRFQTDYKDFLDIPFEYKGVLNDTDETFPVLDIIEDFIKEKWSI